MKGKRLINKAYYEYGKEEVVLWDVQDIKKEQKIKVSFISVNTSNIQGIRLATDKGIGINGNVFPSINLWENTAPDIVYATCYTDNGFLDVYNIWDEGDGRESQAHSSGMLITNEGNKVTYECNDYGFDSTFDKLVFSIEFL